VALSVRRSVPILFHALALATAALVVSAALGTAAYAGVVTTSSVIATTKATIARQPGVHLVISAKSSSSSSTEKIVADFGTDGGVEKISNGNARLAIKVMPTYAFVSGNSSGLTTIVGLSSADAKRVGKHWVSWKAGTSQYSNLKSGITVSSVTAVVPKAQGSKLSTEVVNGAKRYVLRWTTAATSSSPKISSTLILSARGATLPIQETAIASGGAKESTVFSKWGEHVLVSVPSATSTIPYSQLTG
jgi:Cu/Ag efflux pump CusA